MIQAKIEPESADRDRGAFRAALEVEDIKLDVESLSALVHLAGTSETLEPKNQMALRAIMYSLDQVADRLSNAIEMLEGPLRPAR